MASSIAGCTVLWNLKASMPLPWSFPAAVFSIRSRIDLRHWRHRLKYLAFKLTPIAHWKNAGYHAILTPDRDVAAKVARTAKLNTRTRPSAAQRILIVTTSTSHDVTNLVLALKSSGLAVDAASPRGNRVFTSGRLDTRFAIGLLRPLDDLRRAIDRSLPYLIVPADGPAIGYLRQLYREGGEVAELIERSIGSARQWPYVNSRAKLSELARSLGLRVPAGAAIQTASQLAAWLELKGGPAMLKADGGSGGREVVKVGGISDVAKAFRKLDKPDTLPRGLKRLVIDRDVSVLDFGRSRAFSVQSFIAGKPANVAAVCWRGEVLAQIGCEVLHSLGETGPPNVVRLVDNPEMMATVERLARRLQLSGFHGFDFILADGGAKAFLIEMNPRATPTAHLANGLLADALFGRMTNGRACKVVPPRGETIALFPQELHRDPASPHLQGPGHDAPSEAPQLVAAGWRSHRQRTGRVSKLIARVRRK